MLCMLQSLFLVKRNDRLYGSEEVKGVTKCDTITNCASIHVLKESHSIEILQLFKIKCVPLALHGLVNLTWHIKNHITFQKKLTS